MPALLQCVCGRSFKAREGQNLSGKKIPCPKCGQELKLTDSDDMAGAVSSGPAMVQRSASQNRASQNSAPTRSAMPVRSTPSARTSTSAPAVRTPPAPPVRPPAIPPMPAVPPPPPEVGLDSAPDLSSFNEDDMIAFRDPDPVLATPPPMTRSAAPPAWAPVPKALGYQAAKGKQPKQKVAREGLGSRLNGGALGGLAAMAVAALWFFVGLQAGRIFIYPPVMFVMGALAVVKGLFGGD